MSRAVATGLLLISLTVGLLGLTARLAYAVAIEVRKPLPAVVTVVPQTTPVIPGDVDANGTVDVIDLRLVIASFNTTPPSYPPADINKDGIVDIFDLVIVGKNFGRTQP